MANGFSIQVKGLNEALKKVGYIPKVIHADLAKELEAASRLFERKAKEDAPADQGFLRNSISWNKEGDLNFEVVAQAAYAAFVEWGTGQYVSVPAEYQEYAMQFKGAGGGGGFDQFFLAILDWVHRKGLTGTYSVKTQRRTGNRSTQLQQDYDVAFMIALKILKVGIKPHPFFFKQVPVVTKELEKNIENNVIKATR